LYTVLEAGEERGAMWIGKAFKLVVRPLSALSLVVPMFGMLGAVALAGAAVAPALADGCPNEEFRRGPSAELPDCRAYELVSLVYEDGANR
jgi:hypothetical protein